MPKPQKEPLRVLGEQERQELQRIVRVTSERMDVIKRSRALLAVARGQSFRTAATEAGFASLDTVCQLVARFNCQGLRALLIAAGRGRKPTYSQQERLQMMETRVFGAGEKGGCKRQLVAFLVAAQAARNGLTEGGS